MERPTDCDVSLVGHGHGDKDAGAEGDVVQRVDQVGEEVDVNHGGPAERPGRQSGTYVINTELLSL